MKTRPFLLGGVSVLILLVLLSLLSFGGLSLMTANADLKLSRAAAARTAQYYKLESLAAERLQQGDTSFTVSLGNQHLTVTVSDGTVTEWRQWQDSFDYDEGGTDIWLG